MKQLVRYAIVLILCTGFLLLAKPAAAAAIQTSTGQIEAYVWDDLNRNGVQDLTETGIPGVTVNLYSSANALVDTVNTDATGLALFTNLAPGGYYVQIVPPTGYAFTRRHRGTDEEVDSDVHIVTGKTAPITLAAGETVRTWDAGLYPWSAFRGPQPGTVKPPPADVTACSDGNFSVGGVAGLTVGDLKPGYCVNAFLRNKAFAVGRIPDGAGRVLANITFLRVFHDGSFVYKVPQEDGDLQICYAVPAGKQVQIYFFDFYGSRFGGGSGQPSWQPLETTVQNGVACADAQTSGAYALIGQ
jgi:hypothetical protein